ncbi:hypothetical protein [Clostridium sardiniense]|uniref:hypothetical protein n=1 Tax=Clostridium sardiniense TaxID=29369 RepID=UPI00195BDD2E|nr:hypothetical protein [Clostridium sardiniense]MBM7835706.1 hypothetical protein [Clostridium sardiniense]
MRKNILSDELKSQILIDLKNGSNFIGGYHLIRELFIAWNMDIYNIPILNDRLLELYTENGKIKFKNNYI